MLYGSGKYTYEWVEDWAKLPKGVSFVDVCGIAIDNQDRIYVLNRSYQKPMMVFNRQGDLVASWGEGHFSQPQGARSVPDGFRYGDGYFSRAHGICIAPDGSIFCTNDRNHTVSKFTPDGKLLMTLGIENKPSDTGYRDVPDAFERIAMITRGGPPFNRPTGVAVAASGEIYVSDGYGNARIHKFSPDGTLLFSWGEPGSGPGQFRTPHGIHIDKRNRVWVADRNNNRLQIFDSNGNFLGQWTDLIRTDDLFIDQDDVVYVAELCKRVSIFTIDGRLLSRWGNESNPIDKPLFFAPHTLAVDSRGDLYVAEVSFAFENVDRGPNALLKFSRK